MTAPDEPNIIQRIVNAWDCCGTCAGGVLARHVAEERERIAQAIEAERPEMGLHINVSEYRRGMDDGLIKAARIAREQATR